jgi:hypothetical protein
MKSKAESRKSEGLLAAKGEKRLLELFEHLTSEQQDKLIAFAEFLTGNPAGESHAAEPLAIPRPAAETVTMAIRRLARTYPMLDRRHLMGEASELLAQHVLQGRPSAEVIDDLESLFSRLFEQQKSKVGSRKSKG